MGLVVLLGTCNVLEGKACRYRTFIALSVHFDSGQMARMGKGTIVHCPRRIPRHSETLRGIYGCFPSGDSSGLLAESTHLGEGYI